MNAPRLKWKSADGKTQEYLIAAPEVVIGRGTAVDLLLPSLHVSRRHARLFSENGGYEIEDLESRYGTFLNGERVSRSFIRHGDRIVFGKGDEFIFYVEAAEPRQDIDTTKILNRSLTDLGRDRSGHLSNGQRPDASHHGPAGLGQRQGHEHQEEPRTTD